MKVYMTVNILLYGGLSLIVIGFIILIISIIKLRGIEVEKFKQQELHKSFMKARKINKDIEECGIADCNESIFTNLNSTDIFSMVAWALDNAPDEKIDLWHRNTFPFMQGKTK